VLTKKVVLVPSGLIGVKTIPSKNDQVLRIFLFNSGIPLAKITQAFVTSNKVFKSHLSLSTGQKF